jgi:hypothetical protein
MRTVPAGATYVRPTLAHLLFTFCRLRHLVSEATAPLTVSSVSPWPLAIIAILCCQ